LTEGGHILKRAALLLQVVKVSVERTEDFNRQFEPRVGREEVDEPPWVTIGQGTDENSIHEAEDGRARTDTESEREHCGHGKARAIAQRTQAVAEVHNHLFDPQHRAHVAMGLFGLLHPAVSA
jgi:hypothetical protein